jgi:hypothetical protein
VAKVWASKKTVLPSEQDRPDIARKRARWKAYQRQIDPKRLVFIDETWAILRQAQDRLHGGMSPGAPRGNKNAFKHGRYMADAIEGRREISGLLRAMKPLTNASE